VIQGNPTPVSIDTAKRMICAGGTQQVLTTASGGPLDLGRTRRLFDDRQHEALAIRDGGCLWPDCDRPPIMTEAHHINEYDKDHGRTDIADGVCLCRFHHLTLHNNGWRITREGNNYWLIPPPSLDPEQTPIRLHSNSLLIRKLRQSRSRQARPPERCRSQRGSTTGKVPAPTEVDQRRRAAGFPAQQESANTRRG
jgi:hypothetical protein